MVADADLVVTVVSCQVLGEQHVGVRIKMDCNKSKNKKNSLYNIHISLCSRCSLSVLLRWVNAIRVWANAIKVWANAIKVWANDIKIQDQHKKSTNIVI